MTIFHAYFDPLFIKHLRSVLSEATKLDKIKHFCDYLHLKSVISRPHLRSTMRSCGNRLVAPL